MSEQTQQITDAPAIVGACGNCQRDVYMGGAFLHGRGVYCATEGCVLAALTGEDSMSEQTQQITDAPLSGPLKNLHPQLIAENGSGFGFVCIWRIDRDSSCNSARECTVGEWLLKPENQSGTWLIDGGWGGPPGPIHVRWNEAEQAWDNGGYCGRGFTK